MTVPNEYVYPNCGWNVSGTECLSCLRAATVPCPPWCATTEPHEHTSRAQAEADLDAHPIFGPIARARVAVAGATALREAADALPAHASRRAAWLRRRAESLCESGSLGKAKERR